MNQASGAPVAVLIHLASSRRLDEFAAALARIDAPRQVIVNLPRLAGEPAGRLREAVADAFPAAAIIESDNRGMDVGGMFRLFRRALDGPWRYWLYLHSKSDDKWRGAMLDSLTRHARRAIDLMAHAGRTQRHNPVGMAGAFSYPFDYYNIGPFLDLVDELGVTLETDWSRYCARHPAARGLPIEQRVAHALAPGRRAFRPELDLEYARALLGDLHAAAQPMNRERLRRLIADQVLGALPYFPGNFFWIRRDVVEQLAAAVDFEREFEALPKDLDSDREHQSRAHAWERALPVFAVKRGYALATLGVEPAPISAPAKPGGTAPDDGAPVG